MLKVNINKKSKSAWELKKFGDLELLECFKYGEDIYIKIGHGCSNTSVPLGARNVMAVRHYGGIYAQYIFSDNDMVTPIDTEINITI